MNKRYQQMKLAVRYLARSELDWVDRIQAQNEVPLVLEKPGELLHQPGYNGVVAVTADQIAGYTMFCVTKRSVVINQIAVDLDYRGLGVGGRMVEELKEMIRRRSKCQVQSARECNHVKVVVPETKPVAISFFFHMGFFLHRLVPGYCTDGSDGCDLQWYLDD